MSSSVSSASDIVDMPCADNTCGFQQEEFVCDTGCNVEAPQPVAYQQKSDYFGRNNGFRASMRQMFGMESRVHRGESAFKSKFDDMSDKYHCGERVVGNPVCPVMPKVSYRKEMVACTVPVTNTTKVPVQVPAFRTERVWKNVTEMKTKWVKTKVPVCKRVCETVKVPCTKTIYRRQTVKGTKTIQKARKVPYISYDAECAPCGDVYQPCGDVSEPCGVEMPMDCQPCGQYQYNQPSRSAGFSSFWGGFWKSLTAEPKNNSGNCATC